MFRKSVLLIIAYPLKPFQWKDTVYASHPEKRTSDALAYERTTLRSLQCFGLV